MSKWTDPDAWARMYQGDGCPICQQERPRDVIATLATSWVTMSEVAPMRGYCCLVLRRHAVELHDLDEAVAAAYMRDIQSLSRAVKSATGAVKMNYEVHGNTIPHLHMHFFPRHAGDRFEGGPIDPQVVQEPVYADGEFEEMKRRIRDRLAAGRDAASAGTDAEAG